MNLDAWSVLALRGNLPGASRRRSTIRALFQYFIRRQLIYDLAQNIVSPMI
jgi:hypothetical protein